jgi:hypothetical protein
VGARSAATCEAIMIRHRVGTLLRGVLALAADKVFGPR